MSETNDNLIRVTHKNAEIFEKQEGSTPFLLLKAPHTGALSKIAITRGCLVGPARLQHPDCCPPATSSKPTRVKKRQLSPMTTNCPFKQGGQTHWSEIYTTRISSTFACFCSISGGRKHNGHTGEKYLPLGQLYTHTRNSWGS